MPAVGGVAPDPLVERVYEEVTSGTIPIPVGQGEIGEDSLAEYYVFPSGTQVRQISAYLTSFGGQIVQYVARATRLDGQNKGDQLGDLEKARDLIEWEIERVKSELGAN